MMVRIFFGVFFTCLSAGVLAQDSIVQVNGRFVQLSDVIIRSDVNVPAFMKKMQDDTSFYKAFKNLHILSYSSINDIRMLDKKGQLQASLQSKTRQTRKDSCRTMETLEEQTTGDIRDKKGNLNYYTAQLYAGLFFTYGRVCGETNIVKGSEAGFDNKSGIDKHKEQLKMLFFNPGKKIPGIPFIGEKLDVFSDNAAELYDYSIDRQQYNGKECFVFKIKAKETLRHGQRDKVVIDVMTTWFDPATMDVMGRVYDMSYDAGVYEFEVHLEAQLTKFGDLLVPTLLRYDGKWGVIFKGKERGVFTATLYDFATPG